MYIYTYICAIFFAFKEVPWKHHEHHCRDEANSVFFAGSGDESWISFHFEAYGPSFVFVCCAICAMLGIIITVFCIDDRLGVFSISRNCSGHCICQSTEFMTLFWSCSERNDLWLSCQHVTTSPIHLSTRRGQDMMGEGEVSLSSARILPLLFDIAGFTLVAFPDASWKFGYALHIISFCICLVA